MTNGGKPKSSFAKEVVAAFSKSQKYAGVPQVGETAKLGRVKTQKIKNGYKLETKKISLILTKKDGAYVTQDGTFWQLIP